MSEKYTRFKHVRETGNAYGGGLDRWECPVCRDNNAPECRFNLKQDKRGKYWKCRFCKTKLLLEKKNE
ncbi:MAG: hypothetical protein ACOCT9_02510 [archaeon]